MGTYKSLETSVIGNYVSIVAAEIMRINNGVCAFTGDIIYVGIQAVSICCVDGSGHAGGDYAFHHDWNSWLEVSEKVLRLVWERHTKDVQALSDEGIYCGSEVASEVC